MSTYIGMSPRGARQAGAASQAKGQVECSFPQKGNKKVMAKQGEPLSKVVSRGGLRVKFDCKVRRHARSTPRARVAHAPALAEESAGPQNRFADNDTLLHATLCCGR